MIGQGKYMNGSIDYVRFNSGVSPTERWEDWALCLYNIIIICIYMHTSFHKHVNILNQRLRKNLYHTCDAVLCHLRDLDDVYIHYCLVIYRTCLNMSSTRILSTCYSTTPQSMREHTTLPLLLYDSIFLFTKINTSFIFMIKELELLWPFLLLTKIHLRGYLSEHWGWGFGSYNS